MGCQCCCALGDGAGRYVLTVTVEHVTPAPQHLGSFGFRSASPARSVYFLGGAAFAPDALGAAGSTRSATDWV